MASTVPTQDTAAPTPPAQLTPQERRAGMAKVIEAGLAKLPPLSDSLEEFDIQIPVQDGWLSRTKIVRPKADVLAKRALIVYFYGGGFFVGEPDQLLNAARAFAETYGAVVALPSYRLVPETKWPVPFADGWDVLVWLSKHAEEAKIGAHLDAGFIVAGASAGGAVAAVCGGLAMFPNSPEAQEAPKLAKPLTGQFLTVPGIAYGVDLPEEYKKLHTSWEDNSNVEGINSAVLKMVFEGLQCSNYESLWYSPVSTILRQEPANKIPTYLDHCQFDPLRDDATVYNKLLEMRGVQTKIQLFPDDPHTSWTVMTNASKSSNPTIEESHMAGMKWLLSLS
jgi:acetyl esterase/lipase